MELPAITQMSKNFPEGVQTVSRVWDKITFQQMLTAIRKQGLIVKKLDSGYDVHHVNGTLLLRAMNGNHGYLVRQVKNLFE